MKRHEPVDEKDPLTALSEGLLFLAETNSRLLEYAAGQRDEAIRQGFSETAAEQMAACAYAHAAAAINQHAHN